MLKELVAKSMSMITDESSIKELLLLLQKKGICANLIELVNKESEVFNQCHMVNIQEINAEPALINTLEST